MVRSFKLIMAAMLLLVVLPWLHDTAHAEEDFSRIRLEISIATRTIEDELNKETPSLLKVVRKRNLLCVKNIGARCDVDGTATRAGRIRVYEEGSHLRIAIPVNVQTVVRGIGPVGKHIKKDLNFSITALMRADFSISPNWQPVLNLDSKFAWSKPPVLKVMQVIEIDLARQLEPVVAAELLKRQRKVQRSLGAYDLRTTIENAWNELQQPVTVSDAPNLVFKFTPASVGLTDIHYSKTEARFQIGINGHASVALVSGSDNQKPVGLPPLQEIPTDEPHFGVRLPISLAFSEIEARIQERLPLEFTDDREEGGLDGNLIIKDFRMNPPDQGRIKFDIGYSLDTRSEFVSTIDIFDWFKTEGSLAFSAVPDFDSETSILTFKNIDIASGDTDGLIDSVFAEIGIPMLRSKIGEELNFDLSEEVDAIASSISAVLNRELDHRGQIIGNLAELKFSELAVEDKKISITMNASGKLMVKIGLD